MTELIDLQSAYMTQLTTEGTGKLDWIVYSSDERKLATLPKELNEAEMFAILEFARQYELTAFNTGIEFIKEQKNQEINLLKTSYLKVIQDLKEENTRLAVKLEKFIISEE